MDLRLRSNEARQLFSAKTSGRRVFCAAAGVGSAVTARCGDAGARAEAPRRLGRSQNPSPQDPTQF